MMVACSAMALRKAEESKEEETSSPKNKWAKWKRGGIIGAAALTGGTLMAITGGIVIILEPIEIFVSEVFPLL